MSFLMIVLSQSNTASGRPPGSPEQVPRASMTVWMRWAFGPYHGRLSLGQAPDCAPADPAVARHAAMTKAATGMRRLTPGRVPARVAQRTNFVSGDSDFVNAAMSR